MDFVFLMSRTLMGLPIRMHTRKVLILVLVRKVFPSFEGGVLGRWSFGWSS